MKTKLFLLLSLSFLSALGWAQGSVRDEQFLRDSLQIREYNQKGVEYYREGNLLMALDNYEKALGLSLKTYGRDSYQLPHLYYNTGLVYYTLKNYATAQVYLENGMKLAQKIYGEEYPDAESDYMLIGYIYHCNGKYVEAGDFYRKALKIYDKKYPEGHSYTDTIKVYLDALKQDMEAEAIGGTGKNEQ